MEFNEGGHLLIYKFIITRNRAEYIWIVSVVAVAAMVIFGSIHCNRKCTEETVPVKKDKLKKR